MSAFADGRSERLSVGHAGMSRPTLSLPAATWDRDHQAAAAARRYWIRVSVSPLATTSANDCRGAGSGRTPIAFWITENPNTPIR